jgi:hypothetical protein
MTAVSSRKIGLIFAPLYWALVDGGRKVTGSVVPEDVFVFRVLRHTTGLVDQDWPLEK